MLEFDINIVKYIAMYSGGKDSCFNLMHCAAEGHEIVALANLRPADKGRSTVKIFSSVKISYFCLYVRHFLCQQLCENFFNNFKYDDKVDLFLLLSAIQVLLLITHLLLISF